MEVLTPDLSNGKVAHSTRMSDFGIGRFVALGGEHAPHVTILQRHVYTADLDKVFAAASKVFAKENPTSWKLKTFKYYYIPDKSIGLAGIVVEPSNDLLRLQKDLIDAVAPFTAPTGTAAAYVTTPQDPDIIAPLIEYVRVFVPDHSGEHYASVLDVTVRARETVRG